MLTTDNESDKKHFMNGESLFEKYNCGRVGRQSKERSSKTDNNRVSRLRENTFANI